MNFGEKIVGKCSWFGGPKDSGVKHDENLALIHSVDEMPGVFLSEPPDLLETDPGYPGKALGLARRLDPRKLWCAMRFDYKLTPKSILRTSLVQIKFGSRIVMAACVDWGPNINTGRVIDVSPGAMNALKCTTDDEVECMLIDTTGVKVVA